MLTKPRTVTFVAVTIATVMLLVAIIAHAVLSNSPIVFVYLFGSFVFLWGFFVVAESWRALRWPQTLAVVEYLDAVADENSRSVAIRYRYTVSGVDYVGNRLGIIERSGTIRWAERRVASIQSQLDGEGRITVRHHPVKHQIAVVEISKADQALGFSAIGVGSIIALAPLVWDWIK